MREAFKYPPPPARSRERGVSKAFMDSTLAGQEHSAKLKPKCLKTFSFLLLFHMFFKYCFSIESHTFKTLDRCVILGALAPQITQNRN